MKKLGSFIQIIILGVIVLALIYVLSIFSKTPSLSATDISMIEHSEATTVFPTETLIATVLPTMTPGGIIPTPIDVEALPTPQPGAVVVTGRILCSEEPLGQYAILLVIIDEDSYLVAHKTFTDVNGRWFVPNQPTGIYTIMNKPPADFGDTLLGTWDVATDQITDFGDIDFAPVGCEP